MCEAVSIRFVSLCVLPQAVMSSDFAISRFKHLRKLLLVHGHLCYSRLANMILYFIYKNVVRVVKMVVLALTLVRVAQHPYRNNPIYLQLTMGKTKPSMVPTTILLTYMISIS